MTIRAVAVAFVVMLAASACTGGSSPSDAEQSASDAPGVSTTQPPLEQSSADTAAPTQDPDQAEAQFGPRPEIRTGPLEAATAAELDALFSSLTTAIDPAAITRLGESGDVRIAWIIGDILRFISSRSASDVLSEALVTVTGSELDGTGLGPGAVYQQLTDRLIAWDVPAPPGYSAYKAQLFTLVEPGWAPFFADPEGEIDWRWVTWGGVFIDDRELGDSDGCARGCIPALDDPTVTSAEEGAWYPDEALVFGLEIDGETRAFPKNIMEVHEMVNDTLGGRRFGMPYCTLCGSAQAYFTDELTNDLVLRTSGLLSRSNKVMYDFTTKSVFDTFTGNALTGPLREQGVQLEQLTVVTATWGDWKAAHPDTTILAEDGGLGRDYPADPLRGRDDNGPIFPIGDADPRLPIHEAVVGVMTPDGRSVAFPAGQARLTLEAGDAVELAGVHLGISAGGLVAASNDGRALASHQSFWFAWSQFHPDTELWIDGAG